MIFPETLGLCADTIRNFSRDRTNLYAAALAYYTVFSLAPLLLIAIAITGLIYGPEAARGEVSARLRETVGIQATALLQRVMAGLDRPRANFIAAGIGLATLLIGASGLFLQLQNALNALWRVRIKTGRLWPLLRRRLLSFLIVLGTGGVLLVSLLLNMALAALGGYLKQKLPYSEVVLQVLYQLASLGVLTIIFAAIFKVLPDVDVPWRAVWIGAGITGVLFGSGRYVIGLYLGRTGTATAYGAAASLVVLLLWVYYSALILMLGAEFTRAYARRSGARIRPASYAEISAETV